MAFKLITVLYATLLAFAHGGLLTQYSAPAAYSSAPSVSHVYSSIGSVAQPTLLAQAARVLATPAVTQYAPAIKTAYASPLLQGTIANIAYSPASEVSHVYSSIAAQQYAVPQYAAQQYAVPQDAAQQYAIPQYAASQYAYGAAPLAIGSSQQSTIRSLGGTISTYSKAVDTAFSSVRKADTRISNNVYIPALATKTIAVQQPAIIEQKSIPAIVSHVTFDAPSIGAHYSW